MRITATLVNLYNVCKREMWLHANGVRFEHTSDLVFEGKLIHEDSYPQRSGKYEEIIKKSNKVEAAHEWQLKYYIYVFERNGIEGVTGVLEYPTLRKTQEVVLSDVDRERIQEMEVDIQRIISDDDCPPLQKRGICRNCSYFDFCYSGEEDE